MIRIILLWLSVLFITACDNQSDAIATKGDLQQRSSVKAISPDSVPFKQLKRYALVIGLQDYPETKPGGNRFGPLANTDSDAQQMEALLTDFGFQVTLKLNQTKQQFENAVNTFTEALPSESVAVFYYSGHGIEGEDDGINYFIPVGRDFRDGIDVKHHGVNAHWIRDKLIAKSQVAILLLDACRQHLPINQRKSAQEEGFGGMGKNGALIAYATAEGKTADGGTYGHLSVYTDHLMTVWRQQADQPIEKILKETATRVKFFTQQYPVLVEQNPWYESGLLGADFCPALTGCASGSQQINLHLKILPTGATVWLDERLQRISDEDELQLKGLTPGQHVLRIELAGYEPLRESLHLTLGTHHYRFKLEPMPFQHGATWIESFNGMEMVQIKGGVFQMGSPASEAGRDSDERHHPVRVADFVLGKYAVTFAEYDQFAAATGRDLPGDEGWGRGKRPMINVSWFDAMAYAEWLSEQTGKRYRLPTEAEWEYAARAGTTTAYWWGDRATHQYANYGKDSCCGGYAEGNDRWETTSPMGSFDPNPWGLYDMHGNVWEWTCSKYVSDYDGSERKCQTKGDAKRALRGGSWYNYSQDLRAAYRSYHTPDYRYNDLGFRLARD